MDLITSILLIIAIIAWIPLLIIKYYQKREKEFHFEFPITFKWNVVCNFDGKKTITLGVYNVKN
jgi:hypothetical protein